MVHVEQETRGDETTVLDAILQCDVERTELLAEEKRLTSSIEQARAFTSSISLDKAVLCSRAIATAPSVRS